MDSEKPIREADYKRLEEAVYAVVLSPSNAEAKQPLKRLEALCRSLEADMTPYQREKLKDVISCAQEGGGSPRNKDHWTLHPTAKPREAPNGRRLCRKLKRTRPEPSSARTASLRGTVA